MAKDAKDNGEETARKKTVTPVSGTPTAITWVTAPHIVLVDQSDSGNRDDLKKMAAALETQVQRDFAPRYNTSCTVEALAIGAPIPDSAWAIGFFKDADQPGALGYHDTTPAGLPLAKVFPYLDRQDNSPLSVTVSHELLEMLADPLLAKAVQSVIDGKFWALEVCDAVEEDMYEIDGVQVSNFVTPQYFEPPHDLAGVVLDQMGLVKEPYEVRPGGYMQYFDTKGWHQVTSPSKAQRSYRSNAKLVGRALRRQRRVPNIPR